MNYDIPTHSIDWKQYKGSIKAKTLKSYKEPDAYVLLNQDKHLHPIWIPLPQPPDLREIDGWGLEPHEQKFKAAKMSKKLLKLIEVCESEDEIWESIEQDQAFYKEEIAFIAKQWDIYHNGYWCFINGKPTFIDGWHYIYCSHWKFGTGKPPEYRDRNRKFMHGLKYGYTTTLSVKYNEHGHVEYQDAERKIPVMVDHGFRTVLGVAYPKHRKDGASNMCLCAEYMEVITHMGVVGGIISMTGEHAKQKMFDEILVTSWNQMPFFFRPKSTSNKNPNSKISFNADRSRAGKLGNESLGSIISHSDTSESTLYDGGNNIWINVDESGKTVGCSVYMRHRQLKPCVSLGNGSNIFGFLTYPSTVGEMEGSGGKEFFKVCEESHFERRDLSGQTMSGMLVFYMPAYEGLDGFIGPYGESVIDEPTPEQAAYIKKPYGAKAHLESKRQKLINTNDIEGYNEEVRLFPTAYMECFRTTDGDVGFNTKIINERIDELQAFKPEVRIGNFKWANEVKDSVVYWQDDPSGRWVISKLVDISKANRWTIKFVNGAYHKFPVTSPYVSSADPYKFEKVEGSRVSMGGGMVFWDYEESIDHGVPIENWRSYRFVADYIARPLKKEEYCEDMLMQCVYYGAMMNPEIDVPDVWEHFEKRGYGGYLWYEIDEATNVKRATPGFNSRTNKKQQIFSLNRDYIEDHGKRCEHLRLLTQWKDIGSISEMTDYDLIPCSGGCLMAAKGPGIANQFKSQTEETEQETWADIYPMNSY